MKKIAVIAWALGLALAVHDFPPVAASDDAPVHDMYAASARCYQYVPQGYGPLFGSMTVTSVMRDDEDAIDAALQRVADLGLRCYRTEVAVVYLP